MHKTNCMKKVLFGLIAGVYCFGNICAQETSSDNIATKRGLTIKQILFNSAYSTDVENLTQKSEKGEITRKLMLLENMVADKYYKYVIIETDLNKLSVVTSYFVADYQLTKEDDLFKIPLEFEKEIFIYSNKVSEENNFLEITNKGDEKKEFLDLNTPIENLRPGGGGLVLECGDWHLVTYVAQTLKIISVQYLYTECFYSGGSGGDIGGSAGPTGGSSGSGPGDLNDAECKKELTDVLSEGSATNIFSGKTTISSLPKLRSYKYSWICYKSGLYQIMSEEIGTHEFVNTVYNPSGEWTWLDLSHDGMIDQGISFVVTRSYELRKAVPTLGLYNSSMTLDFSVTTSIVCKGFPISSKSQFTQTTFFDVNK